MKKIIAIGFVLLLILLAGCTKKEDMQAKTTEQAQEQVKEAGEEAPQKQVSKSQIKFNIEDAVEGEDTRIKIEGEEGEIVVEGVEPAMEAVAAEETVDIGDDWCKEGEQWNFDREYEGIDVTADWVIKGIVDSGEYAGLCHVLYTTETPLGETTMDYYFAEDGESGYFEIKLPNGQVTKHEWHG